MAVPQLRRALGLRDLFLFYIVTSFSLRWIATAAAAGPSGLVIWVMAALGLFVPLAFLLDAGNHRYEKAFYRGRIRNYWAMPYGERFIWGATAGMLVTLHRILMPRLA